MITTRSNRSLRDLALFGLFFAVCPVLGLLPFGSYFISLLFPGFMLFLSFKRSVQLFSMAQLFAMSVRICYNFNPWLLPEAAFALVVWVPATICGIYTFKRNQEHLLSAYLGYLFLPILVVAGVLSLGFVAIWFFARELLFESIGRVLIVLEQTVANTPLPSFPTIEIPHWVGAILSVVVFLVLIGLPTAVIVCIWVDYRILRAIRVRTQELQ